MVDRIEAASVYLGYSAKRNTKELQTLLKVNPITNVWGSCFVTAIEKICGAEGTGVLAARSYLNYSTETRKPVKGDIVVLWIGSKDSWEGHVGYLVSQDTRSVTLLGGNQDNQVKIKTYPKEKVLGYRTPPLINRDTPPLPPIGAGDII